MSAIIQHIFRFAFVIIIQVFIVNNIDLGGANYYISPFIYISFLFVLPNSINRTLLMLLGFLLGIIIDAFMDTYGIHASACTLIAFIRPSLAKQLEDQSTYAENNLLTIYFGDRYKYIYYVSFLTFVFIFWLFLLEEFSFRNLPIIFLKTILSTLFSVMLILVGQFLFTKKSNK